MALSSGFEAYPIYLSLSLPTVSNSETNEEQDNDNLVLWKEEGKFMLKTQNGTHGKESERVISFSNHSGGA